MSTLRDYIWLNECISYTNISKVLDRFFEPKNVLLASEDELLDVLSRQEASKILERDYTRADEILNDCFNKEIKIFTVHDSGYPSRLKNIENPPLVLYVKGRIPDIDNRPTITVVGTRDATKYGEAVTKNLSYNLAKSGAIIVSGLALGIDCISNRAALEAGMPTIVIMGCSVDIEYPWENKRLLDDIKVTGALISEFPPVTRPLPGNFPRRNRILSGISQGVLVTEAPERSGALITCVHAEEQGRDVFAVPGNIDGINSKGCNRLIKNGAKLVTSAIDIIEEYVDEFGNIRSVDELSEIKDPDTHLHKRKNPYKEIKEIKQLKEVKEKPKEKPKEREGKTPNEQLIYDRIKQGFDTADSIIANCDLQTAMVMSTITLLEIYGDIETVDGRIKIKEN